METVENRCDNYNRTLADQTPKGLQNIANNALQLKWMRLFGVDVDPVIRPGSLEGRYTENEIQLNIDAISKAWYEIADLMGSKIFEIRQQLVLLGGGKPFDLSMSCAHMSDGDGTVVEATSANIIQLHRDKFSQDEMTQDLLRFITTKYTNDPAKNALLLEIRRQYGDEFIASVNADLERFSLMCGYSSRVKSPALNLALQSAIARVTANYPLRKAITFTDAKGPDGLTIVIYAFPGQEIKLTEEDPEQKRTYFSEGITPTTQYLVKELFTEEV